MSKVKDEAHASRTKRACIAFTRDMSKAQLEQRLADVKAKRQARAGKSGHANNILAIDAEIARLSALLK